MSAPDTKYQLNIADRNKPNDVQLFTVFCDAVDIKNIQPGVVQIICETPLKTCHFCKHYNAPMIMCKRDDTFTRPHITCEHFAYHKKWGLRK